VVEQTVWKSDNAPLLLLARRRRRRLRLEVEVTSFEDSCTHPRWLAGGKDDCPHPLKGSYSTCLIL